MADSTLTPGTKTIPTSKELAVHLRRWGTGTADSLLLMHAAADEIERLSNIVNLCPVCCGTCADADTHETLEQLKCPQGECPSGDYEQPGTDSASVGSGGSPALMSEPVVRRAEPLIGPRTCRYCGHFLAPRIRVCETCGAANTLRVCALHSYPGRSGLVNTLLRRFPVVPLEFRERVRDVIRQGLAAYGKPRGIKNGAEADDWLNKLADQGSSPKAGVTRGPCPVCGTTDDHHGFGCPVG